MGDVGKGVRLRFWKTDLSSNLSWISPAQCGLGSWSGHLWTKWEHSHFVKKVKTICPKQNWDLHRCKHRGESLMLSKLKTIAWKPSFWKVLLLSHSQFSNMWGRRLEGAGCGGWSKSPGSRSSSLILFLLLQPLPSPLKDCSPGSERA